MSDIEQKALALVNEVRDERGYHPMSESFTRKSAEQRSPMPRHRTAPKRSGRGERCCGVVH